MKTKSIFLFLLLNLGLIAGISAQETVPFTAEQVEHGETLYQQHCLICHGTRLSNGQFGTPLKGSYFKKNWAKKSVGELVTFAYESMPPDNTMLLDPQEYAEIMAFVFENNSLEAGDTPIPGDFESLNQIMLPW